MSEIFSEIRRFSILLGSNLVRIAIEAMIQNEADEVSTPYVLLSSQLWFLLSLLQYNPLVNLYWNEGSKLTAIADSLVDFVAVEVRVVVPVVWLVSLR